MSSQNTDILVDVDGTKSTVSVSFTGSLEVVFLIPVGCAFTIVAAEEGIDTSCEVDDSVEFVGVTATSGADEQMVIYVNGAIVAAGKGQIVTDHLI